jgi:hypothetical protein
MDGTLTTLLSSGIDAFTNLWDIVITFPNGVVPTLSVNNSPGPYSVRAVGFQPPELGVATYNVNYKAIQLTRPNSLIEGDRTFTLEFRQDSNYALLQDLAQWKHIFFDPSGEGNIHFGALSSPDLDAANYGIVRVVGYGSDTDLTNISDASATNPIIEWNFYDVICTKIGTPSYQRQNSDALTTTATFIFGRHYEPFTSLTPGANETPVLKHS